MIYVFGDSWSAVNHFQADCYPWPSVVNEKYKIRVTNFAAAGNSNQQILDNVIHASIVNAEEKVDHVIVPFTSVGRFTIPGDACNIELCVAAEFNEYTWYGDIQKLIFNEHDAESLMYQTRMKLHAIKSIVQSTWNCNTTFLPVFEDCKYWKKYPMSLLSIMHYKETGHKFVHDAPVYECGLYQVVNTFGVEWCDKHLGPNYERVYFERTNYIDESKYFDDTLHLTNAGHEKIAEYLIENNIILD